MVGKSNGWAMKGEKPKLTKLAPHWSLDDVGRARRRLLADHRGSPDPGQPGHRRRRRDVHLAYTSNNDEEADRLYDELKKILNHIGMAEHHVLAKNFYMNMNIPVAGVAHQAGTCRFGTDPATSVLDENCRAHEVDNLYVVDTSFFPSIGAVNPALTAMANAIRVGEHLVERLWDDAGRRGWWVGCRSGRLGAAPGGRGAKKDARRPPETSARAPESAGPEHVCSNPGTGGPRGRRRRRRSS